MLVFQMVLKNTLPTLDTQHERVQQECKDGYFRTTRNHADKMGLPLHELVILIHGYQTKTVILIREQQEVRYLTSI